MLHIWQEKIPRNFVAKQALRRGPPACKPAMHAATTATVATTASRKSSSKTHTNQCHCAIAFKKSRQYNEATAF